MTIERIEDLDLSVATYNKLRRAGVETVAELVTLVDSGWDFDAEEIERALLPTRCLAMTVGWNSLSEIRTAQERLFARTQELLREMPYTEYLKTAHWQWVRGRALVHADHRCQVCNSPKLLEVHHRSYENRGAEADHDLTVLCSQCHGIFHENGKLARRELIAA